MFFETLSQACSAILLTIWRPDLRFYRDQTRSFHYYFQWIYYDFGEITAEMIVWLLEIFTSELCYKNSTTFSFSIRKPT